MSEKRSRSATATDARLQTQDASRKIFRLAFPALISSLLVFSMNLLNYGIIAVFLDYKAIASYGIISAYTNLAAGFFVPVSFGTTYLIDRLQKKQDPYDMQVTISTLMIAAVAIGALSTVFALLIAPGYIWQVVTPEEIKVDTTVFFRVFAFTLTPILYYSVTTAILISTGQTSGPVLSEISALALHAAFSYIFVGLFGWDLRGLAISAIVAQSTGALINTHLVLSTRRKYMAEAPIRFDWGIIRELAREERTIIFTAVLGGIFAIFLQYFIDSLGIATIAGFTLFFLFQDFIFIPINAFRSPARRLSGEAYEEGGNLLLIRTINPMLIIATLYSILLIPIVRLIGPPLLMLFSHNKEVADIAMKLVDLVTSYYVFYAISTILTSTLEGLGKRALTMNLNIVFNYLIRFGVLLLMTYVVQGSESIAICYPVSWALSAAALSIYTFATYSKSRNYSI